MDQKATSKIIKLMDQALKITDKMIEKEKQGKSIDREINAINRITKEIEGIKT